MSKFLNNKKCGSDLTDILEDEISAEGINYPLNNNFIEKSKKLISKLNEEFTHTDIYLPIELNKTTSMEDRMKFSETKAFKNRFSDEDLGRKKGYFQKESTDLMTKVTLNGASESFKDSSKREEAPQMPKPGQYRRSKRAKKSKFFEIPRVSLEEDVPESNLSDADASEVDTIVKCLKDLEKGKVGSILQSFVMDSQKFFKPLNAKERKTKSFKILGGSIRGTNNKHRVHSDYTLLERFASKKRAKSIKIFGN